MADPVKISDLPAISSVQPNDIVPIVDAALTQTSRATAAQIAAIGGGPPGDGTVTEAKLANGAVTAEKVGFSGPDKLISRTLSGSGAGVEIPCTSYARGLLATSNSAGALSYLGGLQSSESPTFSGTVTVNGAMNVSGAIAANGGITGQIKSGDGTASAPSYSFSGDTDTGISRLGGDGTVSIITNGVERLRVSGDGSMLSTVTNGSTLLPHFGARAWANLSALPTTGIRGSGNFSSIEYLGGTGRYRLNFAPGYTMPDANYSVLLNAMNPQVTPFDVWIAGAHSLETNRFQIHISDNQADGDWNAAFVFVAVFR